MAANKTTNATPIVDIQKVEENLDRAGVQMIKDNREIAQASARRKELIRYYKNEKQVITYVSPMYRPYLGNDCYY